MNFNPHCANADAGLKFALCGAGHCALQVCEDGARLQFESEMRCFLQLKCTAAAAVICAKI